MILSDPVKGYSLSPMSDVLNADRIAEYLSLDARKVLSGTEVFREIDSTNNEAKRRIGNNDNGNWLIVADHQTGGRGRMGHSFFSPAGTGIYMTLSIGLNGPLIHPERITLAAAVAVVRVVQPFLSEKLQLKWVNDIFYRKRKVAGILSEAVSDLETGMIQHVIVGIGCNVRPMDFPEDLEEIAGSLELKEPSRNEIAARIASELIELLRDMEDDSYLEEYLAYSMHPERVLTELGKKP